MFKDELAVMDYLKALVDANLIPLGLTKTYEDFQAIATGKMPCAVFEPSEDSQERHNIAGNTGLGFIYQFRVNIYVCHSKLTLNSQSRTRADMALVGAVSDLLNSDKRLGGNITDGYTRSRQYGSVAAPKLGYIKSTRIIWEGFSVV